MVLRLSINTFRPRPFGSIFDKYLIYTWTEDADGAKDPLEVRAFGKAKHKVDAGLAYQVIALQRDASTSARCRRPPHHSEILNCVPKFAIRPSAVRINGTMEDESSFR